MVKFTVFCLDNNKVYDESNFNTLIDLYKQGKVSDDIRLLSISIDLTRTYENEELYDMEDIDYIGAMQNVLKELNYIDNLDYYTMNKLEAVAEYEEDSITVCIEHLDKYDFYCNETIINLVYEFSHDDPKEWEDFGDCFSDDTEDFDYAGATNYLESNNYVETDYGTLVVPRKRYY